MKDLNNLLNIRSELLNAFDSFESFEKYYNGNLSSKELKIWRRALKNKLSQIYKYLIAEADPGPVKDNTVLFWYNVIKILKENISIILFRLKSELEEYEGHRDVPEALFGEEVIQIDIQRTGKTYKQLEPGYLKTIDDRINFLKTFKLYCDASSHLISDIYVKIIKQFDSIVPIANEDKGKLHRPQVKKKGNKITEATLEEVKTFGFGIDKKDILVKIYNMPLDNGDFIDHDKTHLDTFVTVLTAKDFSSVEGSIYFGCETTQVAYIIGKIELYSKKFTFSNIEKSKRFFSKGGFLINAGNLSTQRSKQSDPKEKQTIDEFFAKLTLNQ